MKVKFALPDYVAKVARMLTKDGYRVHLVGGALRDIVLGIEPDDWDLATDATPDQMLLLFPKSVSTGAKFGMVTALVPDKKGEIYDVQVTTFRSEEKYIDGRWPSDVKFIKEIDLDLGRRDFTFNAMSIDLSQSDFGNEDQQEREVYDPFHGLEDLGLRVVRAVGTPLERFEEDGLRPFKACRMASQLDFDIEDDTFQAIVDSIPVAKMVSMERVRDEFMKMLYNSSKPSKGIELMRKTGLLEIFLPELLEGYGVEQKVWHADDVYWHSLKTCDVAPDRIKLAALLHDIGKPRHDMGDGHFYGHDVEGAEMSEIIMRRMKFSNQEIKRVSTLVRHHMFFYPHVVEGMSDDEAKNIEEHKWTDSAVRRFISRVTEDYLDDLFHLRVADATANPKSHFDPTEIRLLQDRISEVLEKDLALKISDLDISGDDIVQIGVERGPEVGQILEALLEKVIEHPNLNSKEKLLDIAREHISTS